MVAARGAWRSPHGCILPAAPVARLHAEARGKVRRPRAVAVHRAVGCRNGALPVRAHTLHHPVPVARAVGVAVAGTIVALSHDKINLLSARAGEIRHRGGRRAGCVKVKCETPPFCEFSLRLLLSRACLGNTIGIVFHQ